MTLNADIGLDRITPPTSSKHTQESPSTPVSHPISLSASASGLYLTISLHAVHRREVSALISGVVDTVNPKFPGALNRRYTLISEMMKQEFEEICNLFGFLIISNRV